MSDQRVLPFVDRKKKILLEGFREDNFQHHRCFQTLANIVEPKLEMEMIASIADYWYIE